MSSSSTNTKSSGFGITIHHAGQNADNSLAPSPSGGSGDPLKQTKQKSDGQHATNESNKQEAINEDDIKNNKP
ncbi:unnamed protein product [Adineta steineri]|uniref:Uncharacterized protein n=1 Tax=Adineta steineri TaxID=433720 RepID=A0A814UFK1_9BILA|nr:unnamed protein product [Adineta steineri]CAF1229010.1 unnamed protein product [Adineta steineri]CAF3687872.1 unnamed protein product [Adineta steineri]